MDQADRCRRAAETVADEEPPEAVLTHAAGVELIYEGIRLTRSIAHDAPWTGSEEAATDGDIAILAAGMLVARGFCLLTRTDATGKAVQTVQAFGRDKTCREVVGD